MDKESVVHIQIKFYATMKKTKMMKFAGQWMEEVKNTQSEVTQIK